MLACAAAGVLVFGYLLLGGRLGLGLMLDSHLQIVLGSGIYGSGGKTLVSVSTLLASARSMAIAEPAMLIAFGSMTAPAIFLVMRHRQDSDWLRLHLPEGVFLFAAAG